MWRSKKFMITVVLAVVILTAGIGGVALAADNGDDGEPVITGQCNTVWDKMAEILQEDGIDVTSEQLQSAFTEAKEGLRTEAMQDFLDGLVAEGKITREQADAFQEWIEAKPDIGEGFGFRSQNGLPGKGGSRFEFRMQRPGGFHRFGGFGGFCPPVEETD